MANGNGKCRCDASLFNTDNFTLTNNLAMDFITIREGRKLDPEVKICVWLEDTIRTEHNARAADVFGAGLKPISTARCAKTNRNANRETLGATCSLLSSS